MTRPRHNQLAPQHQAQPAPAGPVPAGRFDFIDGLRALAALAVVVLHSFQMYGLGLGFFLGSPVDQSLLGDGPIDRLLTHTFDLGVERFTWAVELFIVISGFSLMLPVIRSREQTIKGGMFYFFKRRARRILPPYYVALAMSLLLIAIVPGMNQPSGMLNYSDLLLPAFEPAAIISHALLIHNASPNLELRINPPMWSIAVEWQIYFLFPLLVLVWRRRGIRALLATGLVFGIGQAILQQWTGWLTYPLGQVWYLLLFVEGMIGAIIAFSQQPALQRLRRLPWHWIAMATFAALIGVKLAGKLAGDLPDWLTDPLLGLASMALLVHLSRHMQHRSAQSSRLLQLLSTAWLVRIGHFSYSLYLIHAPLLVAFSLVWLALETPILLAYGLNIFVGGPLCVLAAYLFFLVFERPFTSGEARRHTSALLRISPRGILTVIRNRGTSGIPVQE